MYKCINDKLNNCTALISSNQIKCVNGLNYEVIQMYHIFHVIILKRKEVCLKQWI